MNQSSKLRIDPRRRSFVRLIGEIRHALNQALAEEHDKRGLTRSDIAKILGVHKSAVTRRLEGTSNMTIETLADLAYALNRPIKITIPSRELPSGSNQHVPSPPAATEASGPTNIPRELKPNSSTSAFPAIMAF